MEYLTNMSLFRFPPPCTPLMTFTEDLVEGIVMERVNRFLAKVKVDGDILPVHVHDPGRIRELIYPGSRALIRKSNGIKTSHSLTAAITSEGEKVMLDTRFHNQMGRQFISGNPEPEKKYLESRFDFRTERGFVEIKGCSMLSGNYAIFPDAPTLRGARHLRELSMAKSEGMDAGVIFLIGRSKAEYFYPNVSTDPSFSAEFFKAMENGVEMIFPKYQMIASEIVYAGNARFSGSIPNVTIL